MNQDEELTPEQKQALYSETMIQYQAIRLKILENIVASLCEHNGATFGGKNLKEYLPEHSAIEFRKLLAALSDIDATKASRMARFFERIHRAQNQ